MLFVVAERRQRAHRCQPLSFKVQKRWSLARVKNISSRSSNKMNPQSVPSHRTQNNILAHAILTRSLFMSICQFYAIEIQPVFDHRESGSGTTEKIKKNKKNEKINKFFFENFTSDCKVNQNILPSDNVRWPAKKLTLQVRIKNARLCRQRAYHQNLGILGFFFKKKWVCGWVDYSWRRRLWSSTDWLRFNRDGALVAETDGWVRLGWVVLVSGLDSENREIKNRPGGSFFKSQKFSIFFLSIFLGWNFRPKKIFF